MAALFLYFGNCGFNIWNRGQVFRPGGAPLHGKQFLKGQNVHRAALKVDHDGRGEKILKRPPSVNGSQAIEIAEICFQKYVPGPIR